MLVYAFGNEKARPLMTAIPTVLFVCVHNAGRSQMAAGYLRHLAAGYALVSVLIVPERLVQWGVRDPDERISLVVLLLQFLLLPALAAVVENALLAVELDG